MLPRAVPARPTEAPDHASYGPAAGDPLTQPLLDFLAPPPSATPAPGTATALPSAAHVSWPCATCGIDNPLEATHCTVCGAPFLSAVGLATRPSVVLPLVGDLSRFSRGQRLLGGLGIALLVMLPVAVLTLLLSKHPATQSPREQVTQFPQQPVLPTPEPVLSGTPASSPSSLPGFPTPLATVTVTVSATP